MLPTADRRYRVVADGRASRVRTFKRPPAAPVTDAVVPDLQPPAALPQPGSPPEPGIEEPVAPTPDPPAAEERPKGPAEEEPPGEPSGEPSEEPSEDPSEEPPVERPADDCGARPSKPDGTYWSCSFVDEFGGTSLDGTKWMPQQTWFSGMTGGESSCYVGDPQTISVRDGLLRLTSRRNLPPFTCASPFGSVTTSATSSTVVSRSRFTQVYGRFEARLRLPPESAIPGSHSAFWLYPEEHTYGPWPRSGEVDIAEWFSARPDNVYPSVHYEGEMPPASTGVNCPMPTASTAFHDYAVEWEPTVMRFDYDGRLCFSHRWTPSSQTPPTPFDQPFYLVLTQVWGGQWNAPVAEMPDTSTLVVDWVRAWQ